MEFPRKHSLVALCASLVLGTLAATAGAQDAPPRKTVEIADAKGGGTVVSVVGEVIAVDAANRIVSIKGPKGNIGDLRVDERARNLDQVKVGDRVRLTYRLGVAIALMKGGDGIREKVETEGRARTPAGDKPGGEVVKTTTVVANVEAVNHKKKTATLKGPEGNLVDVRVSDPQVLKEVKVGDQVAAYVTESVALSVQPVAKK
jgi:hypothetical protein